MRLQKQVNRIVDDKEYAKYVLVVPPDAVQKLQWREGEELEHEVKDEALIVRKTKPDDAEAMRIATKHARIKRK